jgi:phosphatidylglycerol:prolipoprotein diacylglycerol transferase
MQTSPYTWLMLGGVLLGLFFWVRSVPRDRKLLTIYFAGLAGAFLGAKIVYILAEGWMHWHGPDRWLQLATGKSILGALLGGYAGVEISKRTLGYHAATGDWFAAIVPVSIILGRIGCLLHGCCLGTLCSPSWYSITDIHGTARWPAVPVESAFNIVAVFALLYLRSRQLFTGQHFHLYLIAYGIFRFAHESMRETPRIMGFFSGYQIAALVVALFGIERFLWRRRHLPLLFKPEKTLGRDDTVHVQF